MNKQIATGHAVTEDILDYVREKGVIQRLQEARQLEREDERALLAKEIGGLRDAAAVALPPAQKRLQIAMKAKADAEASLQLSLVEISAAQQEVYAADTGFRVEMRLGKIAVLADPRIHQALMMLRDLEQKARSGIATWTTSRKNFIGKKTHDEHSNADEIASVVASIRAQSEALQALLHLPRQDDLQEVIVAHLTAAESACRRVGVNVPRADQAAGTKH